MMSLVDVCLTTITQCKQLVGIAETKYPGFKCQITEAQQRHDNCPLTTDISVMF